MIIEVIALTLIGTIVAGVAIFAGMKTRLTRPRVVRYVGVGLPGHWHDLSDRDGAVPTIKPDLVQAQILDPMFWRDPGPVPGDIRPDPMAPSYGQPM